MDLQIYLKLRKKSLSLKPQVKENLSNTVLNESILSELWYRQRFDRRDLQTTTGKKLIVLSSGERSTSSVVDFVNARIVVNDEFFHGNVEVHLNRSDWFKHKHSAEKGYDNIILHVFYNYDTNKKIKEVKFELCLKGRIDVEMINTYTTTDTENLLFGKALCGTVLLPKDYDYLEKLITAAARARLWIKSDGFFRWLNFEHIEEQTLYEEIVEVYGYLNNRDNFLTLARLIPIKKLRKIVKGLTDFKPIEVIEATYFGVGGFLENIEQNAENEYIKRLVYIWKLISSKFMKKMKSTQWKYYKTRPVNYPQRRIAALSRTMSYFIQCKLHKTLTNFFRNHTEDEIIARITDIFYQPADGYFADHYNFGSKKLDKQYSLFGKEKVNVIFVNTILPYLLYHARKFKDEELVGKVFSIYEKLDGVEKNKLVESFVMNIIQYQQYRKYFLSRPMYIQGIIQLYKDFCEPVHRKCEDCYLVRILKEKVEQVDEIDRFEFIEL